jgi:hypothetical protein
MDVAVNNNNNKNRNASFNGGSAKVLPPFYICSWYLLNPYSVDAGTRGNPVVLLLNGMTPTLTRSSTSV